jgi:hypothetical protein
MNRTITKAQWKAEAEELFGEDAMRWKFVCPSCGYVASIQDWKDAGAERAAIAFSCVGRWQGSERQMGEEGGPCNYAGGGLIRLNPVIVCVLDVDGNVVEEHQVFEFAR